jgi:hypothetical protein
LGPPGAKDKLDRLRQLARPRHRSLGLCRFARRSRLPLPLNKLERSRSVVQGGS